jgi:hypothetical protein
MGCALGLGTVTGSGNVVTRTEDVSAFDKVDVSHGFEVDIGQGEAYGVVVRIDDNLLDRLVLEKRGSSLRIGLTTGRTVREATLEADVTMPELTGLNLSSASHIAITGFKSTKNLDVEMSSASRLRGDIEAGDARFRASSASNVSLRGSADDVSVDATSGSTVNLADFAVADANITAASASEVTVNASGRLDADASSASHVYYLGSPTLGSIDTSSASSVEPK